MTFDNADKNDETAPGELIGVQKPSFLAKPAKLAVDHFDGADFVDLAAAFGLEADPWQEGIVTAVMGRDAAGGLAASKVGVSVPRQNGKNAIIEILELGQAVLLGRRIIHTAHEVKALDVDTPILSARGWVTMGDLVDGDQVWGPDGALTNVIAHPWRFERPCYRLTFDDGQQVVADEDHLWGVTYVSTWGKQTETVVSTKDIAVHGVATVTPREGRDRKTYHFRNQLPAPLDFPEQDLVIDPWVFGAWLGDGYSRAFNISEGKQDSDFVREGLRIAGEDFSESVDSRNGTVIFCIRGRRAILRKLGVLGQKRIPASYLHASIEQRKALLAGIMDTDGTCTNGQCQVGSVSRDLSLSYLQLARSLGYKATWRETRAKLNGQDKGPFFVVQFRASQQDSPFTLPRKKRRLPKRRVKNSRSSYNAIVDIEKVPSRPTRCITVDNASALYCVGYGFIPTHNTNRKAFQRISGFFLNNSELKAHLTTLRQTNGQEAIFLDNGGSIEFISRSKTSGRGYSGDTLILDEAQHLTDETLESLLPVISPSSEPQQIFTGTPPAPNDLYGDVFRRLHDVAHAGTDPTLLWAEWSATPTPDTVEIDADDETLWLTANPALGKRITIGAVQAERSALSDAGFRRERLGMWEQERTSRVLPLEDWDACADPNLVDDGQPVVLAVDIGMGRDAASIAAAGMSVDGHLWVDVIENRRGTPDWVIPRLQAILGKQEVSALMIDVLSPAGSLIEPLEAQGVKVSRTGSNIMAAACGQLYDAVMSHDFRHLDQLPLNLAAASARKRKLGDSWAWNRANEDADITPLVAATLALTGRTYSKKKRPVRPHRQKRKVVVW